MKQLQTFVMLILAQVIYPDATSAQAQDETETKVAETPKSPVSLEQLRAVIECIRRIDRNQCYGSARNDQDIYQCRMKLIVPAERSCRVQAGIRSPYTDYESYAEHTMSSPPTELVEILQSCTQVVNSMCDAMVGDCLQRRAEAIRECRIYVNFEKAAPPPPGWRYGKGSEYVPAPSGPTPSRPNPGVDR